MKVEVFGQMKCWSRFDEKMIRVKEKYDEEFVKKFPQLVITNLAQKGYFNANEAKEEMKRFKEAYPSLKGITLKKVIEDEDENDIFFFLSEVSGEWEKGMSLKKGIPMCGDEWYGGFGLSKDSASKAFICSQEDVEEVEDEW